MSNTDKPQTIWGFPVVVSKDIPVGGSVIAGPLPELKYIRIKIHKDCFKDLLFGYPMPGTSFTIEDNRILKGRVLVVILAYPCEAIEDRDYFDLTCLEKYNERRNEEGFLDSICQGGSNWRGGKRTYEIRA